MAPWASPSAPASKSLGRKPSENLGPSLKSLLEVEERNWKVNEKKQEAERSVFQLMISVDFGSGSGLVGKSVLLGFEGRR